MQKKIKSRFFSERMTILDFDDFLTSRLENVTATWFK